VVHLNTDNTMTTPIPLGVHLGVPDADYFADPAISRSDCKAVDAYSLAHWRADQERQAAGERNDSPALIIGSAAHVQLLEPQTWEDRYAVVAAVEKLEAVAIPPIEKEDTPDVPAVEKLELPDPEQRDDKLWYVTCEPGEGYKTKTAAKKAQRPWAWGGVSYSSRKDAADARKAVADRVKPYKWKGQRYAKRADAVADRDAFKDTIKPYAWDKDRFLTRTDAEFARDSYARGRIQLDPGSFVLARDMANATRSHALVGRCFDPDVGHAEVTVVAVVDGVRCRVRLDWLINGANAAQLELDPAVYGDTAADLCIDYKTSKDARPRGATRSIVDYGYAMQVAMYCDVYEAATGRRLEWLFVFVEKRKPYGVRVYKIDEAFKAWGRAGYRKALAKIRAAQESGRYPGYPQTVEVLTLPNYLRSDRDKAAAELHGAIDKWRKISARRKA